MHGLFRLATGELKWSPREFWRAQSYEIDLALDGRREHTGLRDARQAAWIINGAHTAFWADNFSPLDTTDLYDPDPKTKEEVERDREYLSDVFSGTLD